MWEGNIKTLILSLILTFLISSVIFSQWTVQNTPTNDRLRSIDIIDSSNCWAAGNNGTIIRTTDGGTNWTLENSGTSKGLYSIQFPSGNIGWAVGDNGRILHTTNDVSSVELTSFIADVSNNSVILNWETVTETNNKGFKIEKANSQM